MSGKVVWTLTVFCLLGYWLSATCTNFQSTWISYTFSGFWLCCYC